MAFVFKPSSAYAIKLRRFAADMARKVVGGGVINRVMGPVILRAVSSGGNEVVYTIELPVAMGGLLGGILDVSGMRHLTAFAYEAENPSIRELVTTPQENEIVDDVAVPLYPNFADMRLNLIMGSGRAIIGRRTEWGVGDYTAAGSGFIAVVSAYSVQRSAVLHAWRANIALDENDTDDSVLIISRVNGGMKRYPITSLTDGSMNAVVPANHPTASGEDAAGSPGGISIVQISPDEFGLGIGARLFLTWYAAEWDALNGTALLSTRFVGVSPGQVTYVPTLIRYALVDESVAEGPDVSPRYSGSIAFTARVTNAALPALDQIEPIIPQTAYVDGFTYPDWVSDPSDAHDPKFMEANGPASWEISERISLLAANGYTITATDTLDTPGTTFFISRVAYSIQGQLVGITGVKNLGGEPPTFDYNTISRYSKNATKVLTLLVAVDADGSIQTAKLAENRFTYDGGATPTPPDYLVDREPERIDYCAYYSVRATPSEMFVDGRAKLVCAKRTVVDTFVPTAPDFPSGGATIQGQPEHYLRNEALPTAGQFEYVLVDSSAGETTLSYSGYYPLLYFAQNGNTRPNFGFYNRETRYATYTAQPFCQIAPGYMVSLVSPVASFAARAGLVYAMVHNVDTGAQVFLSAALFSAAAECVYRVSCVTQGKVDDGGQLLDYGTLVVTVDPTIAPGVLRGCFVVYNMQNTVHASGTPLMDLYNAYIGNAICPASIGKSTNIPII